MKNVNLVEARICWVSWEQGAADLSLALREIEALMCSLFFALSSTQWVLVECLENLGRLNEAPVSYEPAVYSTPNYPTPPSETIWYKRRLNRDRCLPSNAAAVASSHAAFDVFFATRLV
jgi:hypothetical protein